MKKIFLTLVACFVGICCANAQDDDNWLEDAPEKYLPHTTQMIISADSPCNQNGEAFKDFIPRFRTDKAFRDSRLKFREEMDANLFRGLAEWNNGNGYALLKAVTKNQKCNKTFGTWYSVSANEVCFRYEEVLPCEEWGGSSMYARFQRIDGKWYCTGCMLAG